MLAAADLQVLSVFLSFRLPVVEVVEVGHDDRHRQGNGQHASDGAQGADNFATDCDGMHVPVPDRGHGDHSPPEGIRYATETRGGVVRLREIHGAGEQDHPNKKKENQESQLPHAGFKCLP